jgi:hypothetical protein
VTKTQRNRLRRRVYKLAKRLNIRANERFVDFCIMLTERCKRVEVTP